MTPAQLKERLAEERGKGTAALLKDLGFEKPDDLKGALGKLKELQDASLSEKERSDKKLQELTTRTTQLEATDKLFRQVVDQQFAKLPEAAQQAIDVVANGDPVQRFTLMQVAAAMQTAPTPATPTTPPGPAPKPPPASSGPGPNPAPSAAAQTKFQEWEAMKARSPMLGDIFYQNNQREIERTRPTA